MNQQRLSVWFCYLQHHHFFKYLTPRLSGKLVSGPTSLLQIRSSESDLNAEVRNLTTTQNMCSELSNKGIFDYAGTLDFQACVYAPGYVEICAAKRRVSKAIMNVSLKYICNLIFFKCCRKKKWKELNLYFMPNRFYKKKDCNYDICLLTKQINYFHRHHSHPICVGISKLKNQAQRV